MNTFRILILLTGLTLLCLCTYAQDDIVPKNVIKIIDGRKYYAHTVAKGETLYGISKRYDVEVKEIVFENPLTINGLKVGETIKIPVPIIVVDPMVLDGKYIFHTV